MLTPILKTRTLAGFVLTYILCGLMILFSVLTKQPEVVGSELLYAHWAFGWVRNAEFILSFLGPMLLVAGVVVGRLRPGETKASYGSANIVMLLMGSIVLVQDQVLFSSPDTLVAMTLSAMILLMTQSTYKRESIFPTVFHIGLLLALATIFLGQAIFLVLPVAFSFSILRPGNWKEWAVLVLGIMMGAVILMLFTIWSEAPTLEFKRVIQSAWASGFSRANANAGHFLLMLLGVVSIAGFFGNLTSGTVIERNLMLSNLAWLATIILLVFLLGLGWQQGIVLAAFPISVGAAAMIDRISRWWVADLLLIAALAAPFIKILWQF